MILAIVALISFQAVWLKKNYKEEKQTLNIRTNVLFREALFRCQAEKFRLDTNIKFRLSQRPETVGVLNAIKGRLRDTLQAGTRVKSPLVITVNRNRRPFRETGSFQHRIDSNGTVEKAFYKEDGHGMIQIMRGVDSLQDSITVKEVYTLYTKMLQAEDIRLPFTIQRKAATAPIGELAPDLETANQVTMGFNHPITYTLSLQDTTTYLLRKMTPQIIISILLISLTVFSFLLLYRNMIQHKKLTALKNDFISNITHELKTPLATVSVAIEAMKNFNALQHPERTKEYLDISANELQRLSLLVDKVLKLSMFEKKQIECNPQVFDLKQLAEEIIASMKLQFEKYEAKVTLKTNGQNFLLYADRLHISSVLFNLLDNALKYSKADPVILVEMEETESDIICAVTDNGIGIPESYHRKIFDKFVRVPSGNTHNVKGYGLGLSYVAYVTRQHNGTIELESEPGIGSRFVIKLSKHHV